MAQGVRPEVCPLYPELPQAMVDDLVHRRSANGGARSTESDEHLGIGSARSTLIDIPGESLPNRGHKGIDLGLTSLESEDVQSPGESIDPVDSKRRNFSATQAIDGKQQQDGAVA